MSEIIEKRQDYWTQWLKEKSHEEIARQLAELESQAEHDTLTGLLNRRGWDRMADQYVRLCDREKMPLSVLVVDLDKFKDINDEWGHDVGDQALIFTSGIIKDRDRGSDVQARIGGDEFGLILPFTDYEGAVTVKNRIVMEIQRSLNEMEDNDILAAAGLSLSIGIGTRQPQESFKKAFNQADENMYRVKRGKDV